MCIRDSLSPPLPPSSPPPQPRASLPRSAPLSAYAMSGTGLADPAMLLCDVRTDLAICLCACYAMCSTDPASGATPRNCMR
eukprot:3269733-Rhodomonas_salina.3